MRAGDWLPGAGDWLPGAPAQVAHAFVEADRICTRTHNNHQSWMTVCRFAGDVCALQGVIRGEGATKPFE